MEIKLENIIKGAYAYFLGLSRVKSDAEELFEELFQKEEKFYLTKSKKIAKSRRDVKSNCIVCDVENFQFPKNSIVFIPQASTWNKNLCPIEKRYLNVARELEKRGAKKIIFAYVKEDVRQWELEPTTGILLIEKCLYDGLHALLTEVNYKGNFLLFVDFYRNAHKNKQKRAYSCASALTIPVKKFKTEA